MANVSYDRLAGKEPDLRIVLVGKTGVGKSAVGNTILGKKDFESKLSFSSLTSECKKETNYFAALNLAVIDTPGLFETGRSNKEIVEEIAKGISMTAPGPHVFLIVLQPTRFTAEEKETVEIIKRMFGEEAAKYTMILFTQGDVLREANIRIENLLETSQPLKHIIRQCSILEKFEDKYHVFDNTVEDPGQVRGLVEKINRLVKRNGGSFYTTEMFEEADRAKQEEMERLLRENPNMNLQDARRRAEKDNSFIRALLKAAVRAAGGAGLGALMGAGLGAAVGAAVGAIGGPMGIAIGAAVGGALGSPVGAAVGAAKAVLEEKACIIQ